MQRPRAAPSRRRLLQSAGLFGVSALAGCLGPFFGDSCVAGTDFSMDPATDAHVANHVSSNAVDLPAIAERVVSDALADGEATYRGHYEPNVHADYVVTDGSPNYYRVDVRAGEHVETTGYRYDVAFGDDVATPASGDRVYEFADLPASDREAFLGALGAKAKIRAAKGARFSVVFAFTDETARERSAFVPPTDTGYVRWQGKTLRLTFAEERPASVVTYTVAAEQVAESTPAFVDHVLAERGIELTGLSAEQRDIVEQATDGGYDACEPYSDAFAGLLEKLSTGEHDFASFVRYDGTWYFASVSQWTE